MIRRCALQRAVVIVALCTLSQLPADSLASDSPDGGLELGGAVRFNVGWLDYAGGQRWSDVDVELLRLDMRGHYGQLRFSLQHRWYEGFEAVHHAWAGLVVDEDRELRLGIVQAPFGLLPYASQSFWFGSGYYLGLEDDHDLGVVWRDKKGDRSWHAGVFLRDEYGTGRRFARYSFDVATTEALPYREAEHLVLRYERRVADERRALAWGFSGVLGRVENRISGATHGHAAAALHLEASAAAWTAQLQWAHYDYGVPGERIALAAFEFPFEIASKADVLTANIFRDFDVSRSWLDSLRCYNNLSTTRATGATRTDSWQNVTGCSVGKGPMFTYVDWVAGRNMWFVGGPGVGVSEPGGDRWRSRLNINLGFYF